MAFQVLPLQAEHASFIAESLVYDLATNPVQSILYATRTHTEAQADYEKQFAASIEASAQTHRFQWVRAVHPDGRNAAWAQWQVPQSRWKAEEQEPLSTNDEPSSEQQQRQQQPSAWANFCQEWQDKDAKVGDEVLKGRPDYWVLCNISTHPDYRRQGAGTLLASWAFDQADKLGLPILLHVESLGPGLPLYKSLGFEERARFSLDLRHIGGHADVVFAVMVREPRTEM